MAGTNARPNFGKAIALRVVGGLASAPLVPTASALVADIVPAPRRAAAMGAVMIGMTAGVVSGPVVSRPRRRVGAGPSWPPRPGVS